MKIIKHWINLDLIEMIQFCLKIYDLWRHPHLGWVYGWLDWWVGWWLGSVQITRNQINHDLIKIIQFCFENLWFVETPPPMGGCIGGWWGHVKITRNQINFDLIEIIQFCLQIDDLWRYLHAHTTHWSQSLAIEIMNITHSLTVWLFQQMTYYA